MQNASGSWIEFNKGSSRSQSIPHAEVNPQTIVLSDLISISIPKGINRTR